MKITIKREINDKKVFVGTLEEAKNFLLTKTSFGNKILIVNWNGNPITLCGVYTEKN